MLVAPHQEVFADEVELFEGGNVLQLPVAYDFQVLIHLHRCITTRSGSAGCLVHAGSILEVFGGHVVLEASTTWSRSLDSRL